MISNLVTNHGNLFYFKEEKKLIVEIDEDFQRYYLNQIPKYLLPRKTKFKPHISVIRNETNIDLSNLNFKQVKYSYIPIINYDDVYFWISVFSLDLACIRMKVGLTPTKIGVTFSPNKNSSFRITIANKKY